MVELLADVTVGMTVVQMGLQKVVDLADLKVATKEFWKAFWKAEKMVEMWVDARVGYSVEEKAVWMVEL